LSVYAQKSRRRRLGGARDENLIRWGHLETFSANKTFGFMVSLKTGPRFARAARAWGISFGCMQWWESGNSHASNYEVGDGDDSGSGSEVEGGRERLRFSCHLDHQRPGANDNAERNARTILEVARDAAGKLISEGEELARPARTIRFIWPPEIEGTLALAEWQAGNLRGGLRRRFHMDMVGGSPATKAVFHVTHGPMSLPSFVHDVAWAFAEVCGTRSRTSLRQLAARPIRWLRREGGQRAAAGPVRRLHDGERSRRLSGLFGLGFRRF